MTERKRKNPNPISKTPAGKNPKKTAAKDENKRKRRPGPRLPSSLRQELDRLNPNPRDSDSESNGEREDDGTVAGDVYEYEEEMAPEETKRNRRFDPVENYEYELPADFEDEDVPSDEDEDIPSDGSDEEEDEGDKHLRMLQGITGMPGEAFDCKEKKEVVLGGLRGEFDNVKLSISDLLDPLQGKVGYGKLRKRLHQLEKKPMAVQAPLPKMERERVERKVAYEHTKKDITKWEPLVKAPIQASLLLLLTTADMSTAEVEVAPVVEVSSTPAPAPAALVPPPQLESAAAIEPEDPAPAAAEETKAEEEPAAAAEEETPAAAEEATEAAEEKPAAAEEEPEAEPAEAAAVEEEAKEGEEAEAVEEKAEEAPAAVEEAKAEEVVEGEKDAAAE